MPKFDGTGPAGKGPKTGGQMGGCADAKPQVRPFDGRGQGQGCRGVRQGVRLKGRGRNA